MTQSATDLTKIQPRQRRQLFITFALLAYGVFLGEIYSVVNFWLWVLTHVLTLAVLGGMLLWPAVKQRHWPTTPLDAPLLALALVMFASALGSAWPRLALEGLFPWLCHVLAFYLAVRLARAGWGDALLRALMLVLGVVVFIAWFELAAWYFGLAFAPQFAQGWWGIGGLANPIPPIWYRFNFTLSNAVILSAFLVMTLPAAVAFALTTRRAADRPLVWLFVLATLFVLVMAQSRGAWVGLGAGMLTLVLLWLRRSDRQSKTVLALLGLAGSLFVAAIALYLWFSWAERGQSNSERLAYWQAALQIFSQNPVWGIGPGLYRWGWRLTPFAAQISERVITAHNLLLNQLAELGVLGVAAGLWLVAATGYTAWQVLAGTPDRRLWWRQVGCTAGLVGFLAQGLFETLPIWPIALPVVVLTAYLLAPARNQKLTFVARSGRLAGPLLAAGWLLAALLVTYFAYPRLLAEQARQRAAQGQFQAAAQLAEQARQLDPGLVLYQFEQAIWLAQAGQLSSARDLLADALTVEPAYSLNHANLSLIEWQLGQPTAAVAHMQQAAELSPTIPQYWLTLGRYAENNGQFKLAASAYGRVIAANPDWSRSDFWQATPWRRANIAAIRRDALSPNLASHEQFLANLSQADLPAAETALQAMGQSITYNLDAARLSLARGDSAAALSAIKLARQLSPINPEIDALQAEILLEAGQLDPAELVLKRAVFLNSGPTPATNYLVGRLAELRGYPEEAIAAYRASFQPPSFSLDYEVAMYRQLGALLPLPQLEYTTAGVTETRGWLALARLEREQGRLAEAAIVYQNLLSIDPYLTIAQTELDTLCRQLANGCPASAGGQP